MGRPIYKEAMNNQKNKARTKLNEKEAKGIKATTFVIAYLEEHNWVFGAHTTKIIFAYCS